MIEYCENQVSRTILLDIFMTKCRQIECRRTSLLEYFGEHFDSRECHATCDNCKNRDAGGITEKTDVTDDCVAILNMVRKLQEACESITLVQASQLFLGQLSKGKERKKDEMTSLEAFGRGKGRYERSEIERVIYHMILRQYLSEMDKKNAMGFTSTFLTSGSNANNLLRGERVHLICKTRRKTKSFERIDQKRKKQKKIVPEAASPVNIVPLPSDSQPRRIPGHHVEALAQLLKDWRASVCDNFNVMPYHILPTSGIAAIANAVPTTSTELSEIDGVGRIRVKKYGEAIISIVQSYLQKHNLKP
uniref:DNA 3'-5' helicase n=1 Tax=Albugo laibachii Nc14 TaxID=890382 RepID=F0WRP7_9STRA|nr:bloom syndrome protein putative [Albugo laibachii Nc14]|eukprot:CCA24011.1 bloom syndrome protein putative [Albugo laibachii Nc14]